MAIQVSGTTVIDDSRNLVNVIGLKTVNSTSLLGSGDIAAGAPTTFGSVGTYALTYDDNGDFVEGSTIAGANIYPMGFTSGSSSMGIDVRVPAPDVTRGGTALSGTWRRMCRSNRGSGTDFNGGICVRIS